MIFLEIIGRAVLADHGLRFAGMQEFNGGVWWVKSDGSRCAFIQLYPTK